VASNDQSIQVLSAASFVVVVGTKPVASFSELSGIKSTMNSVAYTYSPQGGQGGWIHSRQFGQVDPPEVTLKKGIEGPDTEGVLWAWHLAARHGLPVARQDASLHLLGHGPGDTDAADLKPVATYHLSNCWPKQLSVSGAKAGSSEVIFLDVVLTCDEIRLDGIPTWVGR
jgi:phage tail-like protein